METINENSDDSWNIDWNFHGSSEESTYNYVTNDQYYGQYNSDECSYQLGNKQTEWSLENIYYEYTSLYPQLKPLMNLAEEILDPAIVQEFQTKLNTYEANINSLESTLHTPSTDYDYLSLNNYDQYYESIENLPESHYQSQINNEQWNTNLSYDLSQIPVEYIDYNNNNMLHTELSNISIGGSNYGTLDNQSYEHGSIESFVKSVDNEIGELDEEELCKLDSESHSEVQQSDNPDSSLDLKRKKRRKKVYTKKSTENNERRIWYRCGWEGCSFGSYYNGVVKRHSLKRHRGEVRIAQSESDSMHRFKCDWPGCDVSLVAYHKLVEHKRRHTGEKPFGCKWKACQYSTGRLYSLIIHERVHKAEHLD